MHAMWTTHIILKVHEELRKIFSLEKVGKRDRGLMELSIQENRFAGWSRL